MQIKQLIDAITAGNIEIVSEIMRTGIDLNAVDDNGISPMMAALSSNNDEMIDFFLSLDKVGIDAESNSSNKHRIVKRSISENIPLSFAQQRLWLLDQLLLNKPIYNIPLALRLTGEVKIAALEQALNSLLHRHEVLRTGLLQLGEEVYQKILTPEECYLTLKRETVAQNANLAKRIQAEAMTVFDLSQPPLIKATLLQESPTHHVLLLTLHHVVSDGWSLGILSREFCAYYNHYAYGCSLELAELPIQYADFALWQRQHLQGEVLAKQLAYWQGCLQDAPLSLALPTDFPRPSTLTYRGARCINRIDKALSDRLRLLAKEQNCTLFMVLLAVLKVLLYRYTHQEHIVVGTAIANRHHTEIEGLIGFFVNTLALNTRMNEELPFSSFLAQIKEEVLQAHEHQDVPFEQLVDYLKVERRINQNPLFQVMFIMQNNVRSAWHFEGLSVESLHIDYPIAKFDLNIQATELADGEVYFSIEYATDLFKLATMERMFGHFQQLLLSIVENPQCKISEIPMLTATERQTLLVDWNQTTCDYPHKTLHQLFEEQVEKTPDNIAVVYEGTQLTYQVLNEKSNQLAVYIQKFYFAKTNKALPLDTPIAICMSRGLEILIAILAILKAGGAYVSIDSKHPDKRIVDILVDIKSEVLLTHTLMQPRLVNLKENLAFILLDQLAWASEQKSNLLYSLNTHSLAYIVYTSGSTGKPKGVMGTHAGMVNRLSWMWKAYPFEQGEVCCHKTSLNFVDAVAEFFLPLLQGIPLHIISDKILQQEETLRAYLQQHQITRLVLVPSLLKIMLETDESLPSLKYLIVSGEALSESIIDEISYKAPHLRVINLYGSSEVSADATYAEVFSSGIKQPLSIGRPISNIRVYVLNEQMQLLSLGMIGELYIGGTGLAKGYLNQPELTTERFVDSPFVAGEKLYKTGDLVRWMPEGVLEYRGRNDFQVKIRGHRIECGEIEKVILSSFAWIKEMVVVIQENADEKRLMAYIVVKKIDEEVAQKILDNQLAELLPDYMHPNAFVFLKALPLNINGKVDRSQLPAPKFISRKHEYIAPQAVLAIKMAQLWQDILQVETVGMQDNFFHLGGHSLMAMRLLSRIRRTWEIEFPLQILFQSPNLEGVVNALAEILSMQDKEIKLYKIIARPRPTKLPLSFAQQRLWLLDQLLLNKPIYNIPLALRF